MKEGGAKQKPMECEMFGLNQVQDLSFCVGTSVLRRKKAQWRDLDLLLLFFLRGSEKDKKRGK